MRQRSAVSIVFVLVALLASAGAAGANPGGPGGRSAPAASLLGTRFTYQGRLNSGPTPFSGSCNLAFRLFDDPAAGSLVGGPITSTAVAVADGFFTVPLDFGGNAFTGSARWLDIQVKCGADAAFTPLSPRQALTPAPYALALPGLYTQQNATSPNLIGGYSGNSITGGTDYGVAIGGGGEAGYENSVRGGNVTFSVIGGGAGNVISGTNAFDSVIAGGGINRIDGGDVYQSFIGSGSYNVIGGPDSKRSVIGGGTNNIISSTNSYESVIGGGVNNAVSGTNPFQATIAGGAGNTATDAGAAIGGGLVNRAGSYATVAGGSTNHADGFFSTVPGGKDNSAAGQYSFAAGRQASALQDGAFVWADATGAVFSSTAANQFIVRASGGITFFSNPTATVGVELAPGAGAWTIASDRHLKANYAAVDGVQVLNALAGVPIGTWNYTTQAAAIRHIGPMAQDFHAAFGLGESDTGINTVDGQGVALAAIQGLYRLVQAQDARFQAQQAQISDLQQRLAAVDHEPAKAGDAAPPPSAPLPAVGWLLFGALLLLNLGGLLGFFLARAARPRPLADAQ